MDIPVFDADQHYYEAEDCFTRYASERMMKEKYIRWLTELDGKRKRLIVGDQVANVIGNPTFDPITSPGIYHETLKKLEVGDDRAASAYGQLNPISAEYRDRDVRLDAMDMQDVKRTLMFPTLAVTMEGFMADDVELLYDAIHAFNRWLDDDWGFNYNDRIYAAPYISMMDLDLALKELDWLLSRGMKVITIRPGPAYGRSPADPYFDPFWARIEEANVLVTYHAFEGPSIQGDAYRQMWAASPQPYRREHKLLESALSGNDVAATDTLTALVLHNLFGRFPKLKVAMIEMGCGWVPNLMKRLDHAGGLLNRKIVSFGKELDGRPSEIFNRHVWVSPFPEEDVPKLAETIGPDRVLLGSDWPHAESMPLPRDYLDYLKSMPERDARLIAHDNLDSLVAA